MHLQSNSGAACTCVVTEYIYHDKDHFEAGVDMFTMDEVEAQLTDLLQAYRHFHHHRDEMDRDERQDFQDRANVALDTFRAMFRSRLADEKFLVDWDEDSVMETLRSWAKVVATSSNAGRNLVASSLAECSALLMKLTSESASSKEPAMWPYIRKIRFVWLSS